MPLKIALAADHAGYKLKEFLKEEVINLGFIPLDLGTDSLTSVDYPDFAAKLADSLKKNEANYGVLICGSGIGINIAANRFQHIRAALCSEPVSAYYARAHNDANVLTLGERFIGQEIAKSCLHVFLTTPFEGGRHEKRLEKLFTLK